MRICSVLDRQALCVRRLQVLSAVLAHFTRGMPPLSMRAGTKVPADFWGRGGRVRYTLRGQGEGLFCLCLFFFF
jgi:hypothetical protein